MEDKDEERTLQRQPSSSRETTTMVLEKEEEVQEEKKEIDKTKVNLQKLREELAEVKQQKVKAYRKEQAVVQTPNYDLIKEISPEKRKKIYKIEKTDIQKENKPFTISKKLKLILFALVFMVGGAFCLSSGIDMLNSTSVLNTAQTEYELSLSKLLKKISKTDSGNKTLELLETYPEELRDPSTIEESSNWFDTICNFISGLFGG